MTPKPHEFLVTLTRRGPATPWGIRLVGGTDLNAPLIITRVQVGSPSSADLLRGDVITKINDYDARDLRHEDAQTMFKDASNQIKLVIRRDDLVALHQCASNPNSRPSSTNPPYSHSPVNNFSSSPLPSQQLHQNFPPPQPEVLPFHRNASPSTHGPHNYAAALSAPVDSLPVTNFLSKRQTFSPQPTRDHQQEDNSAEAIDNQPYRTTPLVLPGAKVKKDNAPTESYLRHHPNPAMRAHPQHDFTDTLMRQKVADTVIHRFVGDESANGPKIVHKQFNSPIGLYSDSNIEQQIRHTVPQTIPSNVSNRHVPTKIDGYKKTVVFDPRNSETYKALNEGHMDGVREVPAPAQPRTFLPNRLIPGKKPNSNHPAPAPEFKHVNTLGENYDVIQQSGSFKRLMYHLGESDF